VQSIRGRGWEDRRPIWDAGGEDLEVALQHLVPDLLADAAGELLRSLDVGEEHRHLLALTFEGTARGEDLLGKVFRRVRERIWWWARFRGLKKRRLRPSRLD
jgi:hypothetical protein